MLYAVVVHADNDGYDGNDDWVADIDITTTRWHRNWAKQHFVKQEMIIFIFL